MTAPVIFKKEVVAKKNWYSRVKEIMIAAGWQNLSSKPSTDFDVMFSTGESGDKSMYIQLKEFNSNPSLAISNSSERHLYFRLPQQYTPGAPGQAGTFLRSDDWYYALIALDPFDKEAIFNMYYHCNKNRIIILNEFPPGISDRLKGSIQFIGISDRSMGENKLSAPVVAMTQMVYTDGVRATNHPAISRANSYVLDVFVDIPPAPPTGEETFMSEIAYGGGPLIEGVRGFIDGIYALHPNDRINNGDILVDRDGIQYRVLEINLPFNSYYYGAFKNTTLYAFRTE